MSTSSFPKKERRFTLPQEPADTQWRCRIARVKNSSCSALMRIRNALSWPEQKQPLLTNKSLSILLHSINSTRVTTTSISLSGMHHSFRGKEYEKCFQSSCASLRREQRSL